MLLNVIVLLNRDVINMFVFVCVVFVVLLYLCYFVILNISVLYLL